MGDFSDDFLTNVVIDAGITAVLVLYPLWRIFSRAGIRPTAALLVLVPYAGPIMVMLLLAFLDWPAVRRGQAKGAE